MHPSPEFRTFFDDDPTPSRQEEHRIICPTTPDQKSWALFYHQIVTRVLDGTPSPNRHRLFDPEEIFEFWDALANGKGEGMDRTRECFRGVIEGRIPDNPADLFTVPLTTVPTLEILDSLAGEFPHFVRAGILDALTESLVLTQAGDGTLSFDPILLLGDPGVGKSRFFRRLAQGLGIHSTFEIDCAIASAGWILSGSSSTWAGSKPGEIFTLLTTYRGGLGNPLIFLDEIDKVGETRETSPTQTLYTLLEPEGARRFRDEFCPIRMDASRVLWVAAGNEAGPIPPPIRSRFRIFSIPTPTPGEKRDIANGIWKELLENHWGRHFAAPLPEAVLDLLIPLSPREMGTRLRSAAGRALVCAGSRNPNVLALKPEDVCRHPEPRDPRTIGFRA